VDNLKSIPKNIDISNRYDYHERFGGKVDMTISALEAAKTLCELRDWSLSNLQIQKILYLAHMFYLGENKEPLIQESFEAWDYGPVVPEVYRNAAGFGNGPVVGRFWWVDSAPVDGPEFKMLKEAAEKTKGVTAARLVAITHRHGGAWAHNYIPEVRGRRIPNEDIMKEYEDLRVSA
jgi:uncharacterized phage-associated protein